MTALFWNNKQEFEHSLEKGLFPLLLKTVLIFNSNILIEFFSENTIYY